MSDAKFRWFEAMSHDQKIPPIQRFIIGYCGIRYARAPEYLICVRQQTIADNLGFHVNTVAAAFKTAQGRAWLRRVGERQRGRGKRGGDTWELVQPQEIPTPSSGYSGAEYPHATGGIPTSEDTFGQEYPHPAVEIPTNQPSENPLPPAETPTHQGLDTGFSNYRQGFGEGFRAREHDDPEIINGEIVDDDALDPETLAVFRATEAQRREPSQPTAVGDVFADVFGRRKP
jgi:hypothetical protein